MKLTNYFVEQLLRGKDLRELLESFTVVIYEGVAPASPETGVSANSRLVELTIDGNAPSGVDTEKIVNVTCTITEAGGVYTVTIDSVNYQYTSQAGDDPLTILRALESRLKLNTVINAMAVPTSTTDGILCLKSKYVGETFTHSVNIDNSSKGSITAEIMGTATRGSNYCYFAYDSTNKVLSIPENITWRGTATKTGVASFFRLLPRGDDGTQTNQNSIRVQGTCGTFGADMLVTNVNVYEGGVVTVSSANFGITY